MKGRDRFTTDEAAEIRRLLEQLRRTESGTPQKLVRDRLRAIGFYISDFEGSHFTRSDFDELVRSGRVRLGGSNAPLARRGSRRQPAGQSPPQRSETSLDSNDRASAASEALSREPMAISAAVKGGVPDCPGLYALYGSTQTWKQLGLGSPPDARPLYVGKAEDSLVSRDLNTHFATGETGRSSPRRSFAALLSRKSALELVPIPRRPHNPEPKKWDCYALEPEGDEQLTEWMCARLRIAVWIRPAEAHLGGTERAVMRAWQPPLNLIGVETPWRTDVRLARSIMVERSKAWARDRGFRRVIREGNESR